MNIDPFHGKNPFGGFPLGTPKDQCEALYRALHSKEINYKTRESKAFVTFCKDASLEKDALILATLKQPSLMKEIFDSGKCGNVLAILIKNPQAQKSLQFFTSQVSDKWHTEEVYLSSSKALARCDAKRQKEAYSLIFHSFSSLGGSGQEILFGLIEGKQTSKEHLDTMLGFMEGTMVWKATPKPLPLVGLSWMVETRDRFVIDEQVWGQTVVEGLFNHMTKLDLGEGTGWVHKALESVDERIRQPLLLEKWKHHWRQQSMSPLMQFLPKEDIAYLVVGILETQEPALADMVKPWLEKSMIHEEIQSSTVKRKM